MKQRALIQKQIPHLNEQQFKKIYPQQYYSKYAAHINILNFQKDLFNHPLSTKKVGSFTTRNKKNDNVDNYKIKLNKYDLVSDTIQKNKKETVRMQKFVSTLNKKLKNDQPSRSVKTIRNPMSGFDILPQNVIQKMSYLQNQQYQSQLQKLKEKKVKQIQYVNFKKRSHSTKQLGKDIDRSIMADSVVSKSIKSYQNLNNYNMSNTMQLHPVIILDAQTRQKIRQNSKEHLSYKERLQNVMNTARSQIVSINPQDKYQSVKVIMAMNRSIKMINGLHESVSKEKLRMMGAGLGQILKRSTTLKSNNMEEKKKKEINQNDLNEMVMRNKGVRDIGNHLEILSRYQNLMRQRQLQNFIRQPMA